MQEPRKVWYNIDMTNDVYSALDYATAKKILKDLKQSYDMLQDVTKKIQPYMKYKAVFESMRSIIEWYPTLKTQISTYEKIVDTKGKVIEIPTETFRKLKK